MQTASSLELSTEFSVEGGREGDGEGRGGEEDRQPLVFASPPRPRFEGMEEHDFAPLADGGKNMETGKEHPWQGMDRPQAKLEGPAARLPSTLPPFSPPSTSSSPSTRLRARSDRELSPSISAPQQQRRRPQNRQGMDLPTDGKSERSKETYSSGAGRGEREAEGPGELPTEEEKKGGGLQYQGKKGERRGERHIESMSGDEEGGRRGAVEEREDGQRGDEGQEEGEGAQLPFPLKQQQLTTGIPEKAPANSGAVGHVEGAYDPQEYAYMLPSLPLEVREVLAFVTRYQPHDCELETPLKCFIPDYLPAVGEMDAFLKMPRPDGVPDDLGRKVIDEPAPRQSHPSIIGNVIHCPPLFFLISFVFRVLDIP
ncbi:intraflagellar transport protein 46 [Nannochloropsis gaditana]|uniref:Intraflagellar transport protein 46 n=1 Tax=Nannochloropsis gaditana TaxID=72520 RepID=W7U4H6_9STRA|nr:intraflagellar transport protein 46 [Nannochloropsis gaditana]